METAEFERLRAEKTKLEKDAKDLRTAILQIQGRSRNVRGQAPGQPERARLAKIEARLAEVSASIAATAPGAA